MTKREKAALEYIKDYIASQGISPTVQEVAEGLGIHSRGVAYRYLSQLQAKGYISLTKGVKRNITLNRITYDSIDSLTIVGEIAAGHPIEAMETPERIPLDSVIHSTGERFALKVKGQSMENEGILDGDIVVCKQAYEVKEGDIIVALIDQSEATLKHYAFENGMVKLSPAHAQMQPMYYEPERVFVQGVFTGLIRLRSNYA